MQNAKKEVRKKRIPDDKKMESVLDYINKKKSIKTIASECGVSEQSVRDWVNKYQNSTQADLLPSIENVTDYIYTNITPIPLVYTLEEAASVAKISTNQLLHYAALGKVILFIARPIDSVVLTKWQIDLHSNDSSHLAKDFQQNDWFKNLKNSYKIPFLAISCSDCKCLEMGLSISKNEFGSVFDVQNDELIKLEANNEKEDFYYVFNEDFIQKNEKNDVNKDRISIGISKSHLKLSSKELNQLVNDEIKRKANRVPSQEQFAVHENKSTFLVELDQAAFELWGDFNPIKAAIFNTRDKVAEYLEDNFHFFTANALPLAVIITPSANNRILPTNKDSEEITYRPQFLSGVIQAWRAVCMPEKFEKGDNSIKYEEMARKWLTDNWPELTKYEKTISNVVKLIIPDNAPFTKLRKPKN